MFFFVFTRTELGGWHFMGVSFQAVKKDAFLFIAFYIYIYTPLCFVCLFVWKKHVFSDEI